MMRQVTVILISAMLWMGAPLSAQENFNITPLSQLAYWEWSNDIAASDSFVYLLSNYNSLHLLDVSNPQAPREAGYYTLPAEGLALVVAGGYAYVCTYESDLWIIDLSDPTTPVQAGHYSGEDWFTDVAVADSYAYLLCTNDDFLVLNVADPAAPTLMGSCELPSGCSGVVVFAGYAYVTGYPGNFYVVDVANPEQLLLVGECTLSGCAHDPVVADTIVYVVSSNFLRLVDVSDPVNPREISSHILLGNVEGNLALRDSYVYIGCGSEGVAVLNVADPWMPLLIDYYPLAERVDWVAISENSLCLSGYEVPLVVASLAVPTNPTITGAFPSPGFVNDVVSDGQFAFLAGSLGLQILDVSNPAAPQSVAFLDSLDRCEGVALRDSLVFALSNDYYWMGGFFALDVSDPEEPIMLGSCSPYGSLQSVVLGGEFAYAVGSEFTVVDVSNPDSLVIRGMFYLPGWGAYGVALSGNYAYVASGLYGVRVLDISNPDSITEAGFCYTPDCAEDVAISGNYAFVAAAGAGLRLVSLNQPTVPVIVSYCNLPGSALGVTLSGEHAFVALADSGLAVVNVANPLAPYLVGYYETPGQAQQVAVSGAYAYLADGYYFGIYDCAAALPVPPSFWGRSDSPKAFRVHAPYPNPFNPSTVISFELRVPSLVQLEVFDINGARVGTGLAPVQGGGRTPALQERWYPAGSHQISFDGSDLPSGLYFAKLTAGEFSQVQKLVLLK